MADKRNPGSVNRKSKAHRRRRIHPLIVFIWVIIILVFAFCCAVVHYVNMINIVPTNARNIISLSDDIIWEFDVKNILLIGTDGRNDSERGRSDTIILLSVNENKHIATMVSVMRDLYVNIPNHGFGRINTAYSQGGAELLMDTFEENFGIKVDEYITVNFNSFVGIVDAVGGIEITLSDEEANEVNNILKNEVNELMGFPVEADFLESGGTYRLNGRQALCYSRIRYVGDADFERTQRQRTVLNKIIDESKTMNPFRLDSLLSEALPQMTTNIEKLSLYEYAFKSPFYLISFDIEQMRIPVDGSWSYADIEGASVISVDFDENIISLAGQLYDIEYSGKN